MPLVLFSNLSVLKAFGVVLFIINDPNIASNALLLSISLCLLSMLLDFLMLFLLSMLLVLLSKLSMHLVYF
jgi:hypothetical protein